LRRVFSLALGIAVGLVVGAYVVRRLDDASRAVAPANLAGQAGRAAGGLAVRLRHAVEEGRQAAERREAELRARYEVPGVRQALGR